MDTIENLCMGCMSEKVGDSICPQCGYDSNTLYDHNYIAPGTLLADRYIIGALKHRNGEGAMYISHDKETRHNVWVREYFPYTISKRDEETGVIMPDSGYGAQYKALMSDYMDVCNEVKRLSVSDPVIPIENVLGENNTIYAIYKYLDVLGLEEYLTTQGGKISLDEAKQMLIPLYNAVDNMHLRGIIHRGLSPYTVFVSKGGKLYIDAFSLSATRTGGSELQAELFNGYSAPEQYSSTGWQGTWTDVYALAAIFYRSVSGVVPPKSTMISSGRPLARLKDLVPQIPNNISTAIDQAMVVSTQNRIQTVGSLTSELVAAEGVARTAVFDVVPPRFSNTAYADETPAQTGSTVNRTQDVETFGFTEEVDLKNIESFDFKNYDNVEKNVVYEEEDENDDEDKPSAKNGLVKLIIFVVLAILVVVAVIFAVNFANNLVGGTKPDKSSSNSTTIVGSEDDSSDNSSSESSGESSDSSDESGKKEVPDFVGKKYEDIEKDSDYKSNFIFQIKEEDSDKEAGTVLSQSPEKGTKMSGRGNVILTISKGGSKTTMPNLLNMTYEDAMKFIEKYAKDGNVKISVSGPHQIYVAGVEKGIVARTVPEPGAEFDPEKQTVEIHVATGSVVSESAQSSQAVVKSSSSSSKSSSSKKPSSSSVSTKDDNGVDTGGRFQ